MAITAFNIITIATVAVVAGRTFVFGKIPPDARPCYEYLCRCDNHVADCSHQRDKLTYIPKLMSWVKNIYIFQFNYNQLSNFTDETVENITQFSISNLHLRSNGIKHISPHAFKKLKYLMTLDLSDNPVILQELTKTFERMPSSFAYVYLEGLNIDDSDIEGPLLKGLEVNAMVGIHLARNHLTVFNSSQFSNFPMLSTLSLENNSIANVSVSKSSSDSLATLWLGYNNITRIPDFCYHSNKSRPSFPLLYTLSMEFNKISVLDALNLRCLGHIGHLFLSGNQLSYILPETFYKLDNLQMLNISQNAVPMTIRNFAFRNDKLRILKLENSKILYINDEAFSGSKCNLEFLDLSGNNFKAMSHQFPTLLQQCIETITMLACNNCNLTTVPNIVRRLLNLKELFLNNNQIQTIPNNMFDANHRLVKLYLGQNRISTLSVDAISNSVRSQLTNASLEDNPFVCSCEILWLRYWLIRARPLFSRHLTHYTCTKPNDHERVRIVDNPDITNWACFNDGNIIPRVLCVVGTVLICILCFALGYKWRWTIRYIWKWKRSRRSFSGELQPLVTNDAYLLYCDDDFMWVRHQALPNLEERGHLRVCFRHRDFNPKMHTVDSIVYNLRRCRKVLFILSNSFFKDRGSQFELSMVKKHLEESQEKLVVVLLEDIDDRYMTQDLYRLMEGREHVKWTESNGSADLVWRNLLCQFRGTGNRLV